MLRQSGAEYGNSGLSISQVTLLRDTRDKLTKVLRGDFLPHTEEALCKVLKHLNGVIPKHNEGEALRG